MIATVIRRPLLIIATWSVALGLAAIGVRGVGLETDVTEWFPRHGAVRGSYDAISHRLAGISPLSVVVQAREGGTVTEPAVLRAIDELTHHLEGLADVGRAIGIGSLVRDVHSAVDPESQDGIPTDPFLVEQYLLLLESSDELHEFVTTDRRRANVSVRANNNGSERLLSIASEAERWWAANGVNGTSARANSNMIPVARAEREITRGQLSGLGVDCIALLCLYFVIFRSLAITVMALAPTVATVLSTFGLLGWVGASLDAGTVFVGTLAVGVTVDETVHLVTAYARSVRVGDREKAVALSLRRILPALLMTTSTLAGGFLALGASSFAFTRQLGVATAIAMLVCAAANATLLPSLLVLWPARARAQGA